MQRPYSMECMITIWKEVGCFEEGTAYPAKLPPVETQQLDELNLVYE